MEQRGQDYEPPIHMAPSCPEWCVNDHGAVTGEESQVHAGAPLRIAAGVLARLVLSADPRTGEIDGPHVLIGEEELSPAAAAARGLSLTELAGAEPAQVSLREVL